MKHLQTAMIWSVTVACMISFAAAQTPTTKPFAPVPDQEKLHNGHIVTAKVISGAQPEGEESFKALRDLGVKTIISVDGAQPDVETAKKYGMRYVHIPITYSTVTKEQGEAIAKAIDELPGRVYVHCHHGRHRSAAAVAVACVLNGQLKPEQAESVLQTFGTGANYTGLWKAAREARPLTPEMLRAMKFDFPETAKIAPFADAMVEVDHRMDQLREVQKAGWKAPANHPDLDPAHEALQLEEQFREIGRTPAVLAKPENFRKFVAESETSFKALREVLAAKPVNTASAETAFKRVTASCTSCHAAYRD